jgi:hypothetical protein
LDIEAHSLDGGMLVINQVFANNFLEHIQKELGAMLSGRPTIWPGGVQMDHYKGVASALAVRLVPFMREKYEATEFLFGYIPLKNTTLPYLFYQFAALDVKGNSIPGVGNLGAVIRAPIPETYITPLLGLSRRLLPLSAFTSEDIRPKQVLESKVNWTPLLEAINSEKSLYKALDSAMYSATVGNFKVKIDIGRPMGFMQLAPYKGHTVITMQTAPGARANVNRPHYDLDRHYENMLKIASQVVSHPKAGEEIGEQMLTQANAAMMDLMVKQIDAAAGGAQPAAA